MFLILKIQHIFTCFTLQSVNLIIKAITTAYFRLILFQASHDLLLDLIMTKSMKALKGVCIISSLCYAIKAISNTKRQKLDCFFFDTSVLI